MSDHVLDRLSAYVDGEISGHDRTQIEIHLSACAECARLLEELATVDEVSRSLPVAAPPGYFDTFASRVRDRIEKRRAWRVPGWTWAAAAALLVAVLTPITLDRLERSAPPRDVQVVRAPSPAGDVQPVRAPSLPLASAVGGTHAARRADERAEPPGQARTRAAGLDAAKEEISALPPRMKEVQALPLHAREIKASEQRRNDAPARDAAGELLSRKASSADEARALREAWRNLLSPGGSPGEPTGGEPMSSGADEARVRMIEAGALAYRLGRDPHDLEILRADAAAYLSRPDAAQPERVRRLLDSLGPY